MGFASSDKQPVTVELTADHDSVQPGLTTQLSVHFTIEKGWHIYGEHPGDAGLPTKVAWQGPAEAAFGSLKWPKPRQFRDPGNLKTFGYTGKVALSSSLTVSAKALSPLPIRAQVEWLACKELCMPGSAQLDLSLPVSAAP